MRFDADALDAALPASPLPDLVQALRVAEPPIVVAVDLGPRFASFRAADAAGERGAGRIVIDVVAQTTEPTPATPPPATATPPPPPEPSLLESSPVGGLQDHRHRRRAWRRRAWRARRAGHARKGCHARRRPAAEGGNRRSARRAGDPDAGCGRHGRPGRARRGGQQQQGGRVPQPARERVGAPVGRWRGGVLPEPRRLRRTGATRGPG